MSLSVSISCGMNAPTPAVPAAPIADFTGTPLTGSDPQAVTFTDASSGTAPLTRLWEKSSNGGGTWANFASTPTATNPVESFTAGTWSVRETVTGVSPPSTKTRIDYISIVGGG